MTENDPSPRVFASAEPPLSFVFIELVEKLLPRCLWVVSGGSLIALSKVWFIDAS
jgi:hypothetical protein